MFQWVTNLIYAAKVELHYLLIIEQDKKNAFKLGFLGLALSVLACSEKKAERADSTSAHSTLAYTSMKYSILIHTAKKI